MILLTYQRAYGRPLLGGIRAGSCPRQAAQELFAATAVVLAHDGQRDPCLIYANRSALKLWRCRWGELVGMPSRLTAEPVERQARAAALEQVRRREAIENYGGIRVDRSGRRFRISGARLWGLSDAQGLRCGQAACFESWWWL